MTGNLFDKADEVFGRIKDFISKHANIFCILVLLLFGYLFLFLNLGNYRLIDIDETRYVNIARAMFFNGNFITPHLNFEAFLEKPPLFYWMTVFSYKLCNGIWNIFLRQKGFRL